MGYTKIITYGNNIELYEYEKNVITIRGRASTRIRKNLADVQDNGTDGEDSLQERKLGKRLDNGRRASLAFKRIVASNLDKSTPPLLVTITYRENFTDLTGAYRHFSSFIQSLRRRYGKSFKYVSVPEFQKRGAVHFHALIWGLPEEVFLLERKTRGIAGLWGKGYVYLKQTDGSGKLSMYLTKYMTKAYMDPRLKNQKCYVASRNIKRPIVYGGNFSATLYLEQFNAMQDAIVDKTYNTSWLGEGRYRLFKTND